MLDLDPQAVAEAAGRSPAFRLAARHWNAEVVFRVDDDAWRLQMRDGAIYRFGRDISRGPAELTFSGPKASWEKLLQAIPPAPYDDMRFGGHARRVMESYEQWFGDGAETALLRTLGLFDRPASPEAIANICLRPAITGLTEDLVNLAKPQYRQLLARLRRAHLVSTPDPERPDFIDNHPLIREHFRRRLQEEQPAAWREANSRRM